MAIRPVHEPLPLHVAQALSRMVEAGTLSDEEKDKMVSRMSHVARMRAASSRRQEVEQIKALQLQVLALL